MITSNLNQTRSPLLRLPPELREEIWKSAIDDNDDSNLDTDIGRTCRFTYRQDAVRTYRSTMEKHFEPWMTEENYRNVWTWEHDFSLLSSKVQSLFFKTTACAIHVNALVLFFVSRQVRDEASKVLFECFTFDIGFLIFRTDGYANAPPGPFAWGKGFVANFRLIQKLQIYTNGYHCLHSSSVEKLCDYFPGLKYLRLRVRIMDKADPDTDRRLTTRVIESIRTVSGTFPELVPTAYENECGVVVEYCRGGKAKKGGKQLERWIEQQLQRISR